ncbi:hypothetical protein BC827DRAFT_568360 [Russula dissimulans]|nr:hypothetical protein BC827DRAFT_568360 [Russula dissimulans]
MTTNVPARLLNAKNRVLSGTCLCSSTMSFRGAVLRLGSPFSSHTYGARVFLGSRNLCSHGPPWQSTLSCAPPHCGTASVILCGDRGVCTIVMAQDLLVVVFGVLGHHPPDKYGAITHHPSSSESVRQPLKLNSSYLNSYRPKIHQFPPLPCLIFHLVKFQARPNFKHR